MVSGLSPANTGELFFTCDGHWIPKGNRWVAETTTNHTKDNNFFNSSISQ